MNLNGVSITKPFTTALKNDEIKKEKNGTKDISKDKIDLNSKNSIDYNIESKTELQTRASFLQGKKGAYDEMNSGSSEGVDDILERKFGDIPYFDDNEKQEIKNLSEENKSTILKNKITDGINELNDISEALDMNSDNYEGEGFIMVKYLNYKIKDDKAEALSSHSNISRTKINELLAER